MLLNILDNLTIGIILLDDMFRVKYLNEYIRKLMDREKVENLTGIGKTFGELLQCKNTELEVECGTEKSCKSCDVNIFLKKVLKSDSLDEEELVSITNQMKFKFDGNFEIKGKKIILEKEEYVQLEVYEVTKIKELERDLLEKAKTELKLNTILNTTEDLVFYLDSEGRIQYLNTAYANFIGKPYSEILGKKELDFFPAEMAIKCLSNNEQALTKGDYFEEEKFGDNWFSTFKGRVELENNEVGILAMIRDITKYKEMGFELEEKAYKDSLTGLYNRNFYEDKLRMLYLENIETPCSLMVLDIDNFKSINDTYGHISGDEVLKKLSSILKICIRKDDYLIRMGGDEICILIFSEISAAQDIAERIFKNLEKLRELEQADKVAFTVSIGVVEKKGYESLDNLCERADKALYSAKESGKSKFIIN
ncbi:diguanylate cyclase [Cetobacterium sp. 8H]|uniref:sensor domain-containing diguanylate cyclase n=1 Tax=Cetobacterium sp. 8H TaxID=2759681 RepID=UPI00163BDCE3|nr:diguanylate cyclase [Cetobacterium sp. 8H]MBC2851965.1 diguanylate cyclase [Cetobacterium sp. 8H]